jgi:glycosyltransferase involved in cell wall biosynthesis
MIPNGIDMAEFSNLPKEGSFKKKFGIGKDEQLIFFLGRIHRIKGIDILVEAFADISNQFSRAKLVISGPDDGYLSELKALISRRSRGVLLTGPLYGLALEAFMDSELLSCRGMKRSQTACLRRMRVLTRDYTNTGSCLN